jgi:hypothetical protein
VRTFRTPPAHDPAGPACEAPRLSAGARSSTPARMGSTPAWQIGRLRPMDRARPPAMPWRRGSPRGPHQASRKDWPLGRVTRAAGPARGSRARRVVPASIRARRPPSSRTSGGRTWDPRDASEGRLVHDVDDADLIHPRSVGRRRRRRTIRQGAPTQGERGVRRRNEGSESSCRSSCPPAARSRRSRRRPR